MNDQVMNPESMNPQRATGGSRFRDIGRSAAPTIGQYLRSILARKWLVVALTLLSLLLSAVVVNLMTPIYRSTNTLLIEGAKNGVVSIEELYGVSAGTREFFRTQAEFMRSRGVGMRVVREMDLVNNPFFDPRDPAKVGFKDNVVSKLEQYAWFQRHVSPYLSSDSGETAPSGSNEVQYTPEELEEIVLGKLRRNLDVVPVRTSQLIQLRFESPDPELAAKVANTIGQAYITADLDARYEMQETASKWLNERLTQLRIALEDSEDKLQAFREEIGLIATPSSSMGGNVRSLDTASDRLIQARVALAESRQVYNQVRRGKSNRYQVPEVFNNPAVASARLAQTAAEKKVVEFEQSLGGAHPQLLAAREELIGAQSNMRRQSEAVISSIAKRYEVARSTVTAIEKEVAGSRGNIQDINRKEGTLNVLRRDVASNQQIYQTFLARVKETDATSDFRTPIARVLDPAVPEFNPVKPPKLQIILLAGLLGGILASMLAIGMEQQRAVIRSTDEVEEKLGVPLLVAAPRVPREDTSIISTIQSKKPASLYSEAVRTAVTGVRFSTMDIGTPVIAVASTVPEEGKTTLAMNFAIEQARTKKTILIDGDMRKAAVGKRLGIADGKLGLAELLRDAPLETCTQFAADFNLSIILSGVVPRNAHDLLMGAGFPALIAKLKEQYECIVIDTPPIELVSDALPIARECSGVIYVVRADSTPVPMARRGIERFVNSNARILGVFLNAHDFQRASKYYGEYSAYGGYGYGYGRKGYGGYGNGDSAYGLTEREREAMMVSARKEREA